MLYKHFTEKILGLQGILIENIKSTDNTIHVYCKLERKLHKCPVGQPIKFCVNNNPSSNKRILDCGAIRLSDLPRVNSSFLSAECYARRA